jgi:hypothetical protein
MSNPFALPAGKELRAYFLLLEAREASNPMDYLGALVNAPETEIQVVTKRLARRADSTALSILAFLLSDSRTALAAVEALALLGGKGVSHLLESLDDPSPDIQLNVAQKLQFCSLPWRKAVRLRQILHQHRIRTYYSPIKTPGLNSRTYEIVVACTGSLFLASFGTGLWIVTRILGASVLLRTCYQYFLFFGPVPALSTENGAWWARSIETEAFRKLPPQRDHEFWLARGRLEQSFGDRQLEARNSFRRALNLKEDSPQARLELALMERAIGNKKAALETLRAEGRKYLDDGSPLKALEELLTLEEEFSTPYGTAEQRIARTWFLDRLGLWRESLPSAMTLLRTCPDEKNLYLALFRAYRGLKQPRKALAAGLEQNTRDGATRIPEGEFEELRLRVRNEVYPPEVIGRVEIDLDLGRDREAIERLKQVGVLVTVGETVQISSDRGLPPAVRQQLETVARSAPRGGVNSDESSR